MISEVSSFSWVKLHAITVLGERKDVLLERGVVKVPLERIPLHSEFAMKQLCNNNY